MDKAVYQAPARKLHWILQEDDLVELGVPVYQLLGGRYHENFRITHVLSIGTPESMAEEAENV